MKNKINFFSLIFFLFQSVSIANEFSFETKKIEILNEGNLIVADEGRAISSDNNLEIQAVNFEYFKDLSLLKASQGSAFIKSSNIKIDFNELEVDQEKNIMKAYDNVKIVDEEKKLVIETNIVVYDRNTNNIKSTTKSILRDRKNNILQTKYFNYDLNESIIKINDANFKDPENNNIKIQIAYLNTISNKLYGKDVVIDLNNKSFDEKNEPRIKGNSVIYDNENTEITKGIFTTCKKRNGKCPPWALSANKIKHDKDNKVINYKDAWLKVYDMPVAYFPKFFHPDPTVDRKSGFLIPTIKNSPNSNNYLSLPYFKVISENKDFTFTPRFYTDDQVLVQTEYRQVNAKSSHFSDFSVFKHKDGNSKNHFFYEYDNNFDLDYFNDSNLFLNLEKTSNDTYLQANKFRSPLITNYNLLENSIKVSLFSDNLSIDTSLLVYEDLTKEKNSDKYEYVLPKLNLIKNIDNNTNLDGNILFKSESLVRNYQTNILEKTNINDFIFNSDPKISDYGFYNNFDFIVKNVNSNSQNSEKFKESTSQYFSSILQFNSSLPLIKQNESFQKILKPKLSFKMSPNNTKNIRNEEVRVDANSLFNINRLSTNDTMEGGFSLAYGNDFTIFDKKNSREILNLKLANNLRYEENDDLPRTNQLGAKTSNFFGEVTINPSKYLSTSYNNSLKNNLKDTSYENFEAELSVNNFVTTFDYVNENNSKEEITYLKNTTQYNFDDTNSLLFSTRRNKKTDLTEYYNFMYQYKNDCLAASVEYNKDYYSDRDIKPEESIFFKLTIIPFGESSSPNLKN